MIFTKASLFFWIRALSLFVMVSAAHSATAIVDAPFPVFDTKIVIASNTGKMLWLDSNTLAITTYLNDNDYWDGKTVAVDVAAKSAFTLLERGFLQCAHHDGLVAMLKGSLVRTYWGPKKDPSAPEPVRAFFRWNSKSKKLEAEEPVPKPPWNWYICLQTQLNDIEQPGIGFYDKSVRYLDARHGVLQFGGSNSTPAEKRVKLVKVNEAPIPVDVVAGDIALVPQYLPFGDQYLLSTGQFVTGSGRIEHLGKKTDQLPAITMSKDGRVSRLTLPEKLKATLDELGTTNGLTRPSAPGLLVYVDGWFESGAGLYLSDPNGVKRIWCTPEPGKGQPCTIESWELSPDGCNLAFVSQREYLKTVKVIGLCSSTGEH